MALYHDYMTLFLSLGFVLLFVYLWKAMRSLAVSHLHVEMHVKPLVP